VEATLVNLDSFSLEDEKKKDQRKENNNKKSDDGFGNNLLFSTKEDLDMFGSNSLGKGPQIAAGYTPNPYYNQPGAGIGGGMGGVGGGMNVNPAYGQPNMYGAPQPNMMGYNVGVGGQYPPQYNMGKIMRFKFHSFTHLDLGGAVGGYPNMDMGGYPAGAVPYNNQYRM
jgi:hypothetical protein